jgi:outer membrane protein assembly factor BamE (lipoprotein component of BamABCDE complex)
MSSKRNHRTTRWLLAIALATGAASASAATGFVVTESQAKVIAPGMTADEVRSALGRPAQVIRYRTESGPTWIYNVSGILGVGAGQSVVFDVDFGADGKVAKTAERTLENAGGE